MVGLTSDVLGSFTLAQLEVFSKTARRRGFTNNDLVITVVDEYDGGIALDMEDAAGNGVRLRSRKLPAGSDPPR